MDIEKISLKDAFSNFSHSILYDNHVDWSGILTFDFESIDGTGWYILFRICETETARYDNLLKTQKEILKYATMRYGHTKKAANLLMYFLRPRHVFTLMSLNLKYYDTDNFNDFESYILKKYPGLKNPEEYRLYVGFQIIQIGRTKAIKDIIFTGETLVRKQEP